jgi:hypothetical protein
MRRDTTKINGRFNFDNNTQTERKGLKETNDNSNPFSVGAHGVT